MNNSIKNILTIDFEDLFTAGILYKDVSKKGEIERLTRQTDIILEVLDSHNLKVTFFIVGFHAEKHPHLINRIVKNGHHIGTHSFAHKLIYNMTRAEFENDLKKSIDVLGDVCDQKIDSFRAPAWSFQQDKTDFFWEILSNNGIKFSSSIFPTKNFLYGEPNAPRFINVRDYNIIEIPPSTVRYCGKNIPFSGGFYFRFFPYWFIKKSILRLNSIGQPVTVYIHPWELDKEVERIKGSSFKTKFIMNHNIKNNINKFRHLLNDFKFVSIEDYFKD